MPRQEAVWQHVTEVDITSFQHPTYFSLLDIPKPLRAEIVEYGVGGARVAHFSNGRRFSQIITKWQPNEHFAFTFRADPGFRAAYLLDLSNGPFSMTSGAYQITAKQGMVHLTLSSLYTLRGASGLALYVPVRLTLELFQRYLLKGIKANAERANNPKKDPHA